MRPLALASLSLLLTSGCTDAPSPAPDSSCRFRQPIDDEPTPPLHTPRWAFEPWISKDISTADDTRSFVAGFLERDIPVGVVVLDSPWETNYNTFVPNPDRYPAFDDMVSDLRGDGVRTVLWVTQMVNSSSFDLETDGDFYDGPSPNYQEGLDCGFYVDDGASYGWWKGVGAAIDFFNPEAVGWWHRQQDALFDMGVAGFKLDFGESYVRSDPVATFAGSVPHQQYSERYYEDFFRYGVARAEPDELVTMVRPWDESYDFAGRFFAQPEHAPVAWVGDNRRDWVGLSDALDHIFRSAAAGYVVVGSDLGGYLDRDDLDLTIEIPFDLLNFRRWTALSALTPFMQLHGRANLAPWTVPEEPEETVAIYRYWASLHHELVPFFYSLAEQAYAGAEPIVRPLGSPASWPGDYRFMVGDALLVAPMLGPESSRNVLLPEGKWHDWWAPAADPHDGGREVEVNVADPGRIPLFVREGAIVPLFDAGPVTGLGTAASRGLSTILVFPGVATSFTVHDNDGSTTTIEQSAGSITLSRVPGTTYLGVHRSEALSGVVVGDAALAELPDRAALDAASVGYSFDASTATLWIKLVASSGEHSVVVVP